MKVCELIEELSVLPKDANISISAMNDKFKKEEFEVKQEKDGDVEIVLTFFIGDYSYF